jgi:hypothetical protein
MPRTVLRPPTATATATPARTPAPAHARRGALVALFALACTDKGADSGAGANLQVSGLLCYVEGGDAACDVLVENTGTSDAGAFEVQLFVGLGRSPEVGDSPDGTARVAGVAAGDEAGATVRAGGCAGGCEVWVLADGGDAVAESDEADNASGPASAVARR